MISRKEKLLCAVVSVAVATGLTWYAAAEGGFGVGHALLFWMMMSGLMWGALLSILKDTPERNLVIAPFLERHLLKPLEEKRLDKWREEGREIGRAEAIEAIAEIRKLLEERGLNPDEILPDKASEKTDAD